VTTCFADLDLEGAGAEEALTESDLPRPSLVVQSGFGLHALWLLAAPSPDKNTFASTSTTTYCFQILS
jgi:hypothetical protein